MGTELPDLSRLSIAVQFTVVGTLFVYFLMLRRTVRLEELRLWTAAWLADGGALLAVLIGTAPGAVDSLRLFCQVLYLAGKTTFAVLMVSGARNHVRPGAQPRIRPAALVVLVAVWSVTVGLLCRQMVVAQFAQSVMVGVVLAAGAWIVLRDPRSRISRWLGLAMALESITFAFYAVVLSPTLASRPALLPVMYSASFFDAWVELVLALGCLAALTDRSEEQLRYANRELIDSQKRLAQMVDSDPLTGLANRRALRPIMERASITGAILIFIDINEFKQINDRYGHSVGDGVLQRLGRLLSETFRPKDAVMRYGGDEFLVIAPEMDQHSVAPRLARIRAHMAESEGFAPAVTLAIGVTELDPGGDPAAALMRADHLMYHDKTSNRR